MRSVTQLSVAGSVQRVSEQRKPKCARGKCDGIEGLGKWLNFHDCLAQCMIRLKVLYPCKVSPNFVELSDSLLVLLFCERASIGLFIQSCLRGCILRQHISSFLSNNSFL